MEELLRVLCVEDVPEDAELVILNLRKGGYRIEMMRVQSAEEMSKALDLHPWDIVICDYSLPRFSIDAVKLLRSRDQVTPLIFVSGSIGEETAVDALKLGAQDYVLKDQFTRLLPAVQRELRKAHERQQFDDERARKDAELRASDAKFRALIENSHDGIFLLDETQRIIFCSPSVERILGYPPQEILGTFVTELFHPDDLDLATQAFSRCLLTPGAFANCRARVRHNNGSWKITDGVCTNLLNDRNVRGLVVNFRDVTDTAAAQTELQKSEDRFGKAFKSSPLALTISTLADKRYLDANPAFLRLLGYESSEVIGRTADDLNLWVEPEGRASIIETLKRTGMSEPFQTRYRSKTGEARDVIVSADLIEIEGVPCLLAITQDVTETKRLEAQFRQAQKMEAVGRLAGGVAHDFNNLLMIMGGAADLLQAHRSDNVKVDKYTTQIRDAVEKAARLTRQLLAFSRQQVLQPTVLDLNTIIKDLIKMVSRLLGEDIRIELNLNPNLSRVSADRGQIEQVIMNLAVNARDAMPDGGKLTITTQNERLEEDHIGMKFVSGFTPGEYVTLAIADNGVGMDSEIQSHIFEPFFTTKELGKGTGLGLATVYGIVKQSNGFIWVRSEVGMGTTFRIYLPLAAGAVSAPKTVEPASSLEGNETILIVEDEEPLRLLIVDYLKSKGYRIIEAVDGPSAIAASDNEPGTIHALLTDLIMPGFGGMKVAELLLLKRRGMGIVLISGYTDRAENVEHAKFPTQYLQKPFSLEALARAVRTAVQNSSSAALG